MSALEKLYEDLKNYQNFDETHNSEKFLKIVDKIVENQDASSIPILLTYFDDNTEYGWVLEAVSSAIEHYSKEYYVKELLKGLDILLKKAPIWADNFFNRIFNHPEYRCLFQSNLQLTSKENLLKLLTIMNQESPHHKQYIAKVLKRLQQLP